MEGRCSEPIKWARWLDLGDAQQRRANLPCTSFEHLKLLPEPAERRGQPPCDTSVGKALFEFQLGKGSVIKSWDLGVAGMKVRGKCKLTIPSKLGYGDSGSPPKIPGKATLVSDVELLSVGEAADAGAKDTGDSAKDKKKKKK